MRTQGFVGRVLVIFGAAASLSCGGGDDEEDAGPSCGTVTAPLELTLTGVEPAAGSAVANAAIVHSFTVVGVRAIFQPSLTLTATHTAGMPDPPGLSVSLDTSGPDVRYTFAPLSWTNAPANVVIEVNTLQQTEDGCTYRFPKPLFSYSVTP